MGLHRKIRVFLVKGESIFPIDSFVTKRKPLSAKKKAIYEELEKVLSEQKRAMIDLDGTIHKYSKGYADGSIYDKDFPGARKVLQWLKDQGYEIVIFTTRASEENASELGGDHEEQIKKVEDWLRARKIPFDRVTSEKIAADFYVDDKAIRIEDGDWESVFEKIKDVIANQGTK